MWKKVKQILEFFIVPINANFIPLFAVFHRDSRVVINFSGSPPFA